MADGRGLLVGSVARELPEWTPALAPKLRFVQSIHTGVDDLPFAQFPPSVTVAANVGAFAPFVADQAITLVLALAGDLARNFERFRQGRSRPIEAPRGLSGRPVLLLGFGAIAHEIALRLRPFGVRIEAVSRSGGLDATADRVYPAVDLLEALATADIAIDCRPLTRTTRSTIDRVALERMKRDAILVNVGRAATVDEAAIYQHLREHPEFRFGTDVLWSEDYTRGRFETRWPFLELPNFLASPHVGGLGPEPRARALALALDNLARFFEGLRVLHAVERSEYDERAPRACAGKRPAEGG